MVSARAADAVVIWAPAKVNLYLEVLAKRADGYHEIATFMVAVNLYDTLEFTEEASGAVRLACNHPDLSCGPDNLILKAVELLRRRTGTSHGAAIRLTKRIPLAAGLAGGSTDAAATLTGLNRLWKLSLSRGELAELGAELGSDIAFFFHTPAAWCTGRGEKVEPKTLGRPLDLVLVCPPQGLSTAVVFRGVQVPTQPQTGEELCRAAEEGDIDEMGRRLHNRLQPVAETLYPAVADWAGRLAQLGPAGQLMSGSGSSLFALCRDRRQALVIARALSEGADDGVRPRVFLVRSCA